SSALPTLLRPPIASNDSWWYRNINLLSIAYAYRPQLRTRLTQSGRAFLWKPWAFGGGDSYPSFAAHTGILASTCTISPCDDASTYLGRSPTIVLRTIHSISNMVMLSKFS